MAVCRLPNPTSFALRNLSPSGEVRLGWCTQQGFSCRALTLVFATKNSRCSRKSRAKKSNADLCDELREFVLLYGFPENHVPNTKELLEHGRNDLANIVRRRGYRVIAKLLGNTPNGETDPLIDSTGSNVSSRISVEQAVEGQPAGELQHAIAGGSAFEMTRGFNQNGAFENNEDSLGGGAVPTNNDCETSFGVNSIKDAEGGGSLLSFTYLKQQYPTSEDMVSDRILEDSDYYSSVDQAETEEEDQAKIDHLRELLREKELELSLLKQQLEEEKIALSAMQSKVQSELRKVEDIISSKDQELQSAEGSLSGLKEVVLEYRGNAETVEVTGSFNGWQHKLAMDPQMPLNTVNPAGTREATMWSVVLWLYPGVYELKFIVDGHWKIDPQQEFVSRDNIVNNILRVDGDNRDQTV